MQSIASIIFKEVSNKLKAHPYIEADEFVIQINQKAPSSKGAWLAYNFDNQIKIRDTNITSTTLNINDPNIIDNIVTHINKLIIESQDILNYTWTTVGSN